MCRKVSWLHLYGGRKRVRDRYIETPYIPVANDQNNHLRQALPSDILVVLALGRQHAQHPVHREESTGKWCIHHTAPHAHLLIFWREADHFTGAGEELLETMSA